uniref:Protein kinase domain-containing protein n=1 Tax=Glossina palpalis gambiensis TaxID=67801 RepID=A0A1B0B148_9MUSC
MTYSIRNENIYNLQKPSVDWRSTDSTDHHDRVQRQLSVSSDSKLLDDDIREETRVIMRPKKPPRPKSEVFLNKQDPHPRRKRFSAFGGDSPFGKQDAYVKLEPLGEGSYATVYRGFSNNINFLPCLQLELQTQTRHSPNDIAWLNDNNNNNKISTRLPCHMINGYRYRYYTLTRLSCPK